MKQFLMTAILVLAFFGISGAQSPTFIVTGFVVNTSGAPVGGWPVFNQTDSTFATVTLPDGSFQLQFVAAPPGAINLISTYDCNGTVLTQPVLPNATIVFTICDSITPPPPPLFGCYGDFGWQQSANLTVDFYGYAWSFDDPLATFTFQWSFGDGTAATGETTSHLFAAAGIYPIRLIVNSGTCSDTVLYDLEVLDFGPTKTVNVSGYVLNADDQSPVPFWFVSAQSVNPFLPAYGNTDNTGFYSFNLEVADTATQVTIESYDGCTFTSLAQTVPAISGIAGWLANADFSICYDSIIIGPPPGCQAFISYTQLDSFTFQFTATDWNANPAVTFHWDFGDGTTSTEPNPVHTYAYEGIYNVIFNGTTLDTCDVYACEIICLFPNSGGPIDTFYYGCQSYFWAYPLVDSLSPAGGLDYRTFQFQSLSFGQVVNYLWSFGDGTSSNLASPIHTYATDGTYTATLTIETLDGCESNMSMSFYVGLSPNNQWGCQAMFMPLPIPDSIGLARSFVFIDMSTTTAPITSYSWDFGDGTTSNEPYPFHVYAQPGVYNVSLTIVSDSCSSVFNLTLDTEDPLRTFNSNPLAALGQNATASSAATEPQVIDRVSLYPNPVSTTAVVAFESTRPTDFTYSLLDLTGRVVYTQNASAHAGANVIEVPVANLVPGLSLLRIQTESGVQTIKFVKE